MSKVNEPGKYFGEIKSGVLAIEHEKPCYIVDFEFDGIRDGKLDGNRTLTGYFYLSNNDGGRNDSNVAAVMDVTGWNGADLRELRELDPAGTRVWVPVEEKLWEDKISFRAKNMRKSGGNKKAGGNEFDGMADAWVSGENYTPDSGDDVPF